MNGNWIQPQTEEEWQKLNEIIGFATKVQEEFSIVDNLRKEAKTIRSKLIDHCRKCEDRDCPEGCKVKGAFLATYKLGP